MRWGWRAVDDHTWRYDDEWSIAKDWATPQWYVVRGGKWLLECYSSAAEAIEAAEKFMEAK